MCTVLISMELRASEDSQLVKNLIDACIYIRFGIKVT